MQIFFCFFSRIACCAGSSFPDERPNPSPLQWKHRLLTSGPLGTSLSYRLTWEKKDTWATLRLPRQEAEIVYVWSGCLSVFLPLLVIWGSSPWFYIFHIFTIFIWLHILHCVAALNKVSFHYVVFLFCL